MQHVALRVSIGHHGYWPHPCGRCNDVEVPDPMADVLAARDAYVAARKTVAERRRELGRAILQARGQNVLQEKIAKDLGLTREQVRRYQVDYEKWLADNPAVAS